MKIVTDQAAEDAEQTLDEDERPSWLPEQFQTPEMLAKSWKEATQKITAQGQQLSELANENARVTEELEQLLEGRHVLVDRISTLEQAYVAARAGR